MSGMRVLWLSFISKKEGKKEKRDFLPKGEESYTTSIPVRKV